MINEVSPPGWGHTKAEKEKTKPEKPKSKIGGTAHAMQKAQKRGDIPKNMNIFALMWSMKNKGDKPHYKPGVKGKLKGKYKGPEGQNEMIDPKKIRNYKNVSNAVVAKADKEAEKVKDKEQKGTLEFPQMPSESKSSHPGMQSHWVDTFKKAGEKRRAETQRRQSAQRDSPGQRIPPKTKNYGEGWGAVAKAADELEAKSKAREDKARNKKVSSWAKKEDMKLAPKKGKGREAAKALYAGEDIDMPSLVAQAIKDAIEEGSLDPKQKKKRESSRERIHGGVARGKGGDSGYTNPRERSAHVAARSVKKVRGEEVESDWAKQKRIDKEISDRLVAQNVEREKRYQAQQAAKKQAAAKKEEVEIDEKEKHTSTLSGWHGGRSGDVPKKKPETVRQGAARARRVRAADDFKKEEVGFVDKILALNYKELGFETQDDLVEYAVSYYNLDEFGDTGPLHKKDVEIHGRRDLVSKKPKPKPAWVKTGPKPKPKPDCVKSGPKKGPKSEDYVSDFGNKLRQAIEEAKKVNAIDTINKIVKTKTMGKLHGQKVDLFTASAIQQVYNALNKKNQEKMTSVMSKDVHGLLKMADFSMKQMKR